MMMMMMMFTVSRLLASYPHNHGNDDLLFPLWLTVVYSTLNPYAFFLPLVQILETRLNNPSENFESF